jgi:Ca2+-binding RTX toxin-like protein
LFGENSFIGGVLSDVKSALNPVREIIDGLTENIPFLTNEIPKGLGISKSTLDLDKDNSVSVIDLLQYANTLAPANLKIAGFKELSTLISEAKSLSSFTKEVKDAADGIVLPGSLKFDIKQKQFLSDTPSQASLPSNLQNALSGISNFTLPVLETQTAAKLFFGQPNVELFEYRMPKVSLTTSPGFAEAVKIPIVVPALKVTFGPKLSGLIDLGFGYDTSGFYIKDVNGTEKPELKFSGEFRVGVELGAENIAEIQGGGNIGLEAKFFINSEQGKARTLNFTTGGSAYAYLDASASIDAFGPATAYLETQLKATKAVSGYFSKITKDAGVLGDGFKIVDKAVGKVTSFFKENKPKAPSAILFNVESPRVPLWEFGGSNNSGGGQPTQPILATLSGDVLFLNIGTRAGERKVGNITDDSETFRVRQTDTQLLVSAFGLEQAYPISDENKNKIKIIADGGLGDDTITIDTTISANLKGGKGNDKLYGSSVNDILAGGDNNDILEGRNGNDVLFGETGDDTLRGGNGNDILNGGTGKDILEGGNENDELLGNEGVDTLRGGNGNDLLDGGDDKDIMYGDAGEDTLYGGQGNDEMYGGSEEDVLFGESGSDILRGGDDSDLLAGEEGDDILYGDAGDDFLYGGTENDTLYGDANDGKLFGNDKLFGEEGDDILYGEAGDDELAGGDGIDQLYGGLGNDSLNGGSENDKLYGDAGDDKLYGDAGDDELAGGAGDDQLYGGIDNDTLNGGDDNDQLFGEDGNDILKGEANNDELAGGADADTLYGGAGDDKLSGDAGNDLLLGEAGNDLIDGGTEVDTVSYENALSRVVVNIDEAQNYENSGGSFHPTIVFSSLIPTDTEPNFTINAGTAKDGFGTTDSLRNLENIIGSGFNDVLIGNSQDNRILGNTGNDLLVGNAGNDYFDGGEDSDTVSYRRDPGRVNVNLEQNEAIDGFDGNDQIYHVENVVGSGFDDEIIGDAKANVIHAGDGDDFVETRDGNDIIFCEGGQDTLSGENGDDFLVGGTDADRLNGGEGNDTASYFTSETAVAVSLTTGTGWTGDAEDDRLEAIENLEGSQFEDLLIGDSGNNILSGLGGNDLIYGEAGDDWLDGGTGSDSLCPSDTLR